MTATWTRNREAGRAAMWWLYKDATFFATLMNTTSTNSPPALTAPIEDWMAPSDYSLDGLGTWGMGWNLSPVGATVINYDSSDTDRAVIARVSFDLDFAFQGSTAHFDYTFTDIVVTCQPDLFSSRADGSPGYSGEWTVGVIHESSPRTLNTANASESYKLDLFAESA